MELIIFTLVLTSILFGSASAFRDEIIRKRGLLEEIERRQGKDYSKDIMIQLDNNNPSAFKCSVIGENILPKSYAFSIPVDRALCANRMFPKVEELGEIIDTVVDKAFRGMKMNNCGLKVCDKQFIKKILLFSVAIRYFYTKSYVNVKSERLNFPKFTRNDREQVDNFSTHLISFLNYNDDDFGILANYLNIYGLSEIRNSIELAINETTSHSKIFTDDDFQFLRGKEALYAIRQYFINILAKAVKVPLETAEIAWKKSFDEIRNTSLSTSVYYNITNSEGNILCFFDFVNLCGFPPRINDALKERSYLLRVDFMSDYFLFYNDQTLTKGEEYFSIFEIMSSLDYLLNYGDSHLENYKNFYRLKIPTTDIQMKNLRMSMNEVKEIIGEELFEQLSMRGILLFDLYVNNLPRLSRLLEILVGEKITITNFYILRILKESIGSGTIEIELLDLINKLNREDKSISEENSFEIKKRIKILKYVFNSRVVLYEAMENLSKEIGTEAIEDIRASKRKIFYLMNNSR